MLAGIRVLELSSRETMLAGSILADLGADVIVVEPPGGADGRRLEPFLDGLPGLERSLTWQALNRNKRGMTLAIETPDGVALLRDLVQRFDVVIEATASGSAPSLADDLSLRPSSVHCTIRPFAQNGPKAGYLATDLVLMAASGALGMMGDPDRPPVPLPVPQGMMEAGAEAAIAVLASLAALDGAGTGQRADVNGRLAAMVGAFSTPVTIGSGNPEGPRPAGGGSIAGVNMPTVYPCADGFVVATLAFGSAWGPMTNRLAAWVHEEGFITEELGLRDWAPLLSDLQEGRVGAAQLQGLVDGLSAMFATRSKDEIWREARERSLLVAPAMDMADVATSPQFLERGVWNELTWASRTIRIPARFAQFSNYSITTRRPAPMLSQHTNEILAGELSLSQDELQALFVHGVI